MKKFILKSAACLFLLGLAWSCSSENDVIIDQTSGKDFQQKNGSIWEGVIGIERDGEYIITADRNALLADLENTLEQDGHPVKLVSINIERKFAANDPGDMTYFLIAGTGEIGSESTSIGKLLVKNGNGFSIRPSFDGGSSDIGKTYGCRGCGTGCFLEYYIVDGHYVPYCDRAGCGSDCVKEVYE